MQRVTFISARGESIELYQSPFFLNKIEGLGNVSANIQSQKTPGQDGSTPVDTALEERYIPIEVVILKDLQANRQLISRVFNPKLGQGTLIYENDITRREIKAMSEHVPEFPDERPRLGQRAFIDLVCHDPYFRDGDGDVLTEIALWESNFSFPLEIPEDGIEMGFRAPSIIANVANNGHSDTGMIITFTALKTVTNPSLVNVNTLEFLKINRIMTPGEVITVNTHRGSKRITSTLNGVTTNALNVIVYGSTFLQLFVGDNLFRYGADVNEEWLEVRIYHSTKYVGV